MSDEVLKSKIRKYYVTMTDKFMSDWGMAQGKTNKFVVETDSWEKAETIKRNAMKRPEMKYININLNPPKSNKRTIISKRKYEDLGDIWKL